jgi:Amidohydrolase
MCRGKALPFSEGRPARNEALVTELITDVHTHPLLAEYKRILTGDANAETADGVAMPRWTLDLHMENMDEHGIGAGILSLPGMTNVLVGGDACASARRLNDELATTVSEYPARLGAFAVVPMHDMDAALAETAYQTRPRVSPARSLDASSTAIKTDSPDESSTVRSEGDASRHETDRKRAESARGRSYRAGLSARTGR